MAIYDVGKLIAETRRIAADYKRATGKSLPVSSEIARHDACELLQLDSLEDESVGGYDAIGKHPAWKDKKIQIKGRAIFDDAKSGQRIGQMKLDKEWDAVVLVLMNADFDTQEIYMATREEIETELSELVKKDSKRQNRGAMTIARFKHLAKLVWTPLEKIIIE